MRVFSSPFCFSFPAALVSLVQGALQFGLSSGPQPLSLLCFCCPWQTRGPRVGSPSWQLGSGWVLWWLEDQGAVQHSPWGLGIKPSPWSSFLRSQWGPKPSPSRRTLSYLDRWRLTRLLLEIPALKPPLKPLSPRHCLQAWALDACLATSGGHLAEAGSCLCSGHHVPREKVCQAEVAVCVVRWEEIKMCIRALGSSSAEWYYITGAGRPSRTVNQHTSRKEAQCGMFVLWEDSISREWDAVLPVE